MAILTSPKDPTFRPFGVLVSTRLQSPRLADDSLIRTELLMRACPASFQGGRLYLVTAPAGFGKSTFLAQCQRKLQGQGITTAWLTLDQDDNEADQFFYYLGAAFASLDGDVTAQQIENYLGQRHALNSRRLLAELLAGISQGGNCALLLDDYHCIENPEIHEALQYLLKHLPANLALYIGSRSLPPIALAKLKAADQLVVFDSQDLGFSDAEAQALLQDANQLHLDECDVALLRQRTDGWAAVLQLAALSLRAVGDRHQWISDFHANKGSVADFLAEEVLAQLPVAQADFLARIAIAERFCAPLCLAITGDADNSASLAKLRDSRLLVQSLDEQGYWYRLHPLFRDFLIEIYLPRLLDKKAIIALQMRASGWYEDEGLMGEAIQHAINAGDEDKALELLDEQGLTLLASGQFSLLFSLVRRLPDSLMKKSQAILTQLAWLQLLNNHLPEGRRLVAELKQQLIGEPEVAQVEIFTMEANIHFLSDELDAMAMLADIWAPRAPAEPVYLRAALRNFQTLALYSRQRYAEALTGARAVLAIPTVPDLVFTHAYSACLCGFAHIAMAQLREAISCLEHFLVDIQQFVGMQSQSECLIDALLGALYYYQGDFTRAEAMLQRGRDVQHTIASVDLVMHLLCARNRLLAHQGCYDEATAYLAESQALAESRGWWRLQACVAHEQVRLYIALGEISQAQAVLDRWRQRMADHGKGQQLGQAHVEEWTQMAHLRLSMMRGDQIKVAVEVKAMLDDALLGGRRMRAVELCLLLARSYALSGKSESARQVIEQALALDEEHSLIQPFRDEGDEIIGLLAALGESLANSVDAERHLLWQNQIAVVLTPYQSPLVNTDVVTLAIPESATGLAGELTKKELATLALLVEGFSNKEISDRMCVSTNTVKTHLQSAYGKLGVSRRTQAVRCLKRLGIFE